MIFTFTHLADAFIQSELQCIQAIYYFFVSMCVPWELNPQPFALLTQCSTTEPQEHSIRPLCMRQGSKRNYDSVSVEELDWSAESSWTTSGVTLNADREPKIHHQTPMTHGIQSFHTLRNSCNRGGNTIFKYTNYVSIFVATVWKHPFLF